MVDIMATPDYENKNNEDFEDGELPEDGEIEDDEEMPPQDKDNRVFLSQPLRTSPSLLNSSSPNGKTFVTKKLIRGYGDDTEMPLKESLNREIDSGDIGFSGEDKDYRFDDEGSGDSDYRQGPPSRRRRHSPSDDDDPRAKRSFRGGPWRPYRKPRGLTEHQICKFFREGYCRDGDNCAYSHQAVDSLRKAELCRYYQQGFCKKGLHCLALHGEFPCKAFNKGECSRDPCQFSHQPLDDYTRPLFERMLQDEELGPIRNNHHGNSAALPPLTRTAPRRTLLPQGPSSVGSATGLAAAGPSIHAPIPQQPSSSGQLAPPSVVVPTLASQHHHHVPSYASPAAQRPVTYFPSPVGTVTSPHREDVVANSAPSSAQFDITQMLAQIAGEASVDESPASPPMMDAGLLNTVRTIPDSAEVVWRLLSVDTSPPYLGCDSSSMVPSDPRKNRVLSSQFDAVSSLFAKDVPAPADPRAPAAPVVRDPRRRPDERRSDEKPRVSSWMPHIA